MPTSLRSSTGHLQISNTGTPGANPSSTTTWAYWGIAKLNGDLASIGVMADVTFDGGNDAAVGYMDGGDDNAYCANILGGAANLVQVLASRPTIGHWFAWFKDQSGSGGTQRFGWYDLDSPAGWVTASVTGLTSAQASAFYNQGLNSNSNPLNMDCIVWRCGNTPLTTAQYLADVSSPLSQYADVFDKLLTGPTSGDWTENLPGGVAVAATQGGTLSTGDVYTFPTTFYQHFPWFRFY